MIVHLICVPSLQCRIRVECIRKNHIVNNLIEAYLRANPEKKRPEEDLKELDAKNKITKDMVRIILISITALLCLPASFVERK